MRDLIGYTSRFVALASLVGLGYGITAWRFGRVCATFDCCPHEAGAEA